MHIIISNDNKMLNRTVNKIEVDPPRTGTIWALLRGLAYKGNNRGSADRQRQHDDELRRAFKIPLPVETIVANLIVRVKPIRHPCNT